MVSHKKLPSKICNIGMSGEWHDVTARVYEVLGFPKKTIPKNMEGTFDVDGHKITIFKSGAVPGKKSSARHSAIHRMYFNIDGTLVPTGRVKQFCKAFVKKAGFVRLTTKVPSWRGERKVPLAGVRRKGRK